MFDLAFLERMKSLLGDEYESFISALSKDAVRGLRINTLKVDKDAFLRDCTLPLLPIEYCEYGFILQTDESIGRHAEHHSGRIYMQDPGAMAPLSAIDIPKGARVVDLCAAPGGKSGQAAAMIGEEGFLLSNEFGPKRAKTLVGNFERLGIRNAIVTSLDTGRLSTLYSYYFDFAIVDAPCSGEGMFRKSEIAVTEWSEENVRACQSRQSEILENAEKLVAPGGYLIYSTCTYSLEENEMIVDSFLKKHNDFSLVKPKESIMRVTSPAVTFAGASAKNLEYARRFYPHIANGEGQFLAIMRRAKNESLTPKILYKDSSRPPSKADSICIEKFFSENLTSPPEAKAVVIGENIVLIPHALPPVPKSSVFMCGVLLGSIQKGRLVPEHHFFSAYGNLFKRRIELSENEAALSAYLYGEEIDAGCECGSGFCAVTYKGTAIGGGKIVNGRVKNHYPKGLRNKTV